jgi:adenine-specific DNA-methyltransferase
VQEEINKNKDITANSEQLAALKAQFPSCFDKDGRFRPDKLEDIVRASGADITREGYKLDWLGKSYARLLANLKTETLLAPNVEHNALPENAASENLLIQGDNLDVLKHLVNAYSEKVKVIYIDPPYNTGSDGFVYKDTRKFTVAELQRLAGVDEDEAKRILDFTQSSSNSHSAWLTFMYPRLYVARELLREDGVIFISIDGNEQAQLKLLCDEVFGAENHKNTIAVRRGIKSVQSQFEDIDSLSQGHEYLLLYSRIKTARLPKLTIGSDENHAGKWDTFWRGTDRHTMRYPLFDKNPSSGQWRWEEKRTKKAVQNYIDFIGSGSGLSLDEWFLEHLAATNVKLDFVRQNEEGTVQYYVPPRGGKLSSDNWMDLLLSGNETVFDTEKSVKILQRAVGWLSAKNDLILDFFSGSGTTAHAVMALNAQDGGHRKHISVQLDEPTDVKSEARKAGYNTIFEITRERIKRAAAKIREDHPAATCDFGFKEFKTIPANEGPFQGYLDNAATRDDYVPFNGMALDDDAITALLTTWKAYDGLPLHLDLIPVDLDGYTAYQGGDKLYFVNTGLEIKNIVAMLTQIDDDASFTPRKIVVFHYRFYDKQLREFSEAINAPNRKHLQLDFIQRF